MHKMCVFSAVIKPALGNIIRRGGGIEMTEKLGVLLLELPNSWFRYILLMKSVYPVDKLTIWETDDKEDIVEYAYQCTRCVYFLRL